MATQSNTDSNNKVPEDINGKNTVYVSRCETYCIPRESWIANKIGHSIEKKLREINKEKIQIFILGNFVYHKRGKESLRQYYSKTTSPEIIRLVLDLIIKINPGKQINILIGNAPLQSAEWGRITVDSGLDKILTEYNGNSNKINIKIVDLRKNIQPRGFSSSQSYYCIENSDEIIKIDLASSSMLERQSGNKQYRVLDYPASRIERMHGDGKHIYLIARQILESDIILSVPKLKTHEKVGMTAAIKGCVGIVAHKDCLAHHSLGAVCDGGDEYKNANKIRSFVTNFHHVIYGMDPGFVSNGLRLIDRVFRKAIAKFDGCASGSWRGNDTAWRMSIDLARITLYGDHLGKMMPTKQRSHFVLTDGILAGQGQGPLDPKPLDLGWLSYSENIAYADLVNSVVMGFSKNELPIVYNSLNEMIYPLVEHNDLFEIKSDGNGDLNLEDVWRLFGKKFDLPKGW